MKKSFLYALFISIGFVASPAIAQMVSVVPSTNKLLPGGGTINFKVTANYTGSAIFALEVKVPSDWAYISGVNEPKFKPEKGQCGSLGWTDLLLTGPVSFSFDLSYPAGTTSAGATYQAILRQNGTRTNIAIPASSFGVIQAPQITIQPSAQTVSLGQNAIFTVAANGTAPISYQWKKNGATIVGATNPVYMLAQVATADVGIYSAVVTNSAGAIISQNAALVLAAKPQNP